MRWKWLLVIVPGLLLGLLAICYFMLSRYDFNRFKPEIARLVKAATGRELVIGGDIGLKVDFSPLLTMDDVGLQNASWGSRPEMVRTKRFEVQVALLPLLRDRIEVKRLVLVEPDVLIETDQAGKSNFSLEKPAQVVSPPGTSEPGGPARTAAGLRVGEIELQSGKVEYRDGQSGRTFSAAVEHFVAVASAPEGAVTVRGKGARNGVSFEFSGTVGALSALLVPDQSWPVNLAATVAGMTVTAQGTVTDVPGVCDYTFNLAASGPSAADLIRMVKGGTGPELGPFKILARVVGQRASLSVESFDIEVGLEQLVAWKLTGRLRDPLAWRGAELAFRIFGKDLALVGGLARRPIPLAGPFEVSGHLRDAADKVYQFSELKITAGESDLAGALQVDVRGDRPGVTGSLSSTRLDLRPFLAGEKGDQASAAGSSRTTSSGRVFSSDPLSIDSLQKVNAKIQLDARRIYTVRLVVDNLTASVVLDNGALSINPLKAAIGGGTLNGKVALRPRGKGVSGEVGVKVNRMDVDFVARELGLTERPGGKLDLDLDLRGAGGSVAEIMAGLNGRTLLVMNKGRINNKYLNLLGTDVSRSLLRLLNPLSQESSQVPINCFVSSFDIRGGIAQSTALVMDNDAMTVVGEGTINLKTEELDLSFKPSPKEGLGVSGLGKISLGLGELARPFKLGGTLAKPALVFDVRQAAVSIGKTLGGAVLFGPAGIAAYLAGSSPKEENACVAAVEASKKGVKAPGGKLEQLEDAARKATGAAADGLRRMFGR